MTREEKYRQVRREAGATGVLLALIILFWCAAGFGLAGVPVFFISRHFGVDVSSAVMRMMYVMVPFFLS